MKLPKLESLIITVFFLCIGLWAISKCASKRSQLGSTTPDPVENTGEGVEASDLSTTTPDGGLPKLQNQPLPVAEPAPVATQPPATKTTPPGTIPKLTNEPQEAPAKTAAPAETYSSLFVTINGLKMRKEPNLKAAVVTRLKLDEEVFFLNEKSEKPEEINLGYETVTEYWVKVRTKSGKEGWVFGAGVHYYKMKRKGVME
ncbi:MAG: SH3 domain-containing protein [Saprospiraceae bacterium]|nr:SH3 domain-containing protein [Lewinellaceae bacterium]